MKIWRLILIGFGFVVTLVFWGQQVRELETLRQEGDIVFLELRPVDPRALMTGDYMALGYNEQAFPDKSVTLDASGKIVLALDTDRVGRFARIDEGTALAENELRLNYARHRDPLIGAERFYFQEGTAQYYEPARYGVFKVGPNGRAILVSLAGDDFQILKPIK